MFKRPESHPGFRLLVQAHEYSKELKRPVWDFAVEIASLRRAGFSNNDLRWLVCQGYSEHRCEISSSGEDRRMFRRRGQWSFFRRSCFVLTDEGIRRVREEMAIPVARENGRGAAAGNGSQRSNGHAAVLGTEVAIGHGTPALVEKQPFPLWDAARQELCVGNSLVKQFRLPAPNQGRILMAFEEEGWPSRIDDPLPPQPDLDPKRRLHDTIKSLNRNQKHRLLRFKGDGQGLGILWEFIPAPSNGRSSAAKTTSDS